MNKLALALVLGTALSGVSAAPALARPSSSMVDEVLGSCGTDDTLLAHFEVFEAQSSNPAQDTNRLRVRGSITRTGTGVVGRYAETQLDSYLADGSESYAGSLSRLVVAGGKGFSLGGRATVSASGDFAFTPGLRPLVEEDWVSNVCSALG